MEKNESIAPEDFTFDVFLTFYRHLCTRSEVDKIFQELGPKQKPYLTAEQFKEFLNAEQRDPRLNEILYPYFDIKRAQAIIDQYEPNNSLASKESRGNVNVAKRTCMLEYIHTIFYKPYYVHSINTYCFIMIIITTKNINIYYY